MKTKDFNETGETSVINAESTPENQTEKAESNPQAESTRSKEVTGENSDCDAGSTETFEDLIKGRYKKEFADKVQEIINKRFKENKVAKAKENQSSEGNQKDDKSKPTLQTSSKEDATETELAKQSAELVAMGFKNFELEKEMENPTFKALVNGGLDLQTAYKAVHFDEIMDGSALYGATLGAKRLADSIRFKVGRPAENGLSSKGGYAPGQGVSGLTAEKRRELAKKSLMGESVSF